MGGVGTTPHRCAVGRQYTVANHPLWWSCLATCRTALAWCVRRLRGPRWLLDRPPMTPRKGPCVSPRVRGRADRCAGSLAPWRGVEPRDADHLPTTRRLQVQITHRPLWSRLVAQPCGATRRAVLRECAGLEPAQPFPLAAHLAHPPRRRRRAVASRSLVVSHPRRESNPPTSTRDVAPAYRGPPAWPLPALPYVARQGVEPWSSAFLVLTHPHGIHGTVCGANADELRAGAEENPTSRRVLTRLPRSDPRLPIRPCARHGSTTTMAQTRLPPRVSFVRRGYLNPVETVLVRRLVRCSLDVGPPRGSEVGSSARRAVLVIPGAPVVQPRM